mmetsp:Transcript_7225/g.12934  ORF Transcript_7225/g.12934 Transcript_7225/m.12934 type:complete len:95 (+) Transcript_7225:2143-2427(+)
MRSRTKNKQQGLTILSICSELWACGSCGTEFCESAIIFLPQPTGDDVNWKRTASAMNFCSEFRVMTVVVNSEAKLVFGIASWSTLTTFMSHAIG